MYSKRLQKQGGFSSNISQLLIIKIVRTVDLLLILIMIHWPVLMTSAFVNPPKAMDKRSMT